MYLCCFKAMSLESVSTAVPGRHPCPLRCSPQGEEHLHLREADEVSDGALSRDSGTLSVPTLVFKGHERAHLLPLPLSQQVLQWHCGPQVLQSLDGGNTEVLDRCQLVEGR